MSVDARGAGGAGYGDETSVNFNLKRCLDNCTPVTYFIHYMNKHDEPGPPGPGGEVARLVASSVATMLKNQSSSGAFIASPDFAEYQYCWLRDGSFTAYALDCAGEHEASRAFHEWSAAAIEGIAPAIEHALDSRAAGEPVDPRRMPPARFSLSGCPVGDDWPNFQIDGYGTWLWSLQQHLDKSGEKALPARLAPSVDSVGRYLVGFGTSPCYDVWEESGDSVHTATLGCVFAGLEAAASMLGRPRLPRAPILSALPLSTRPRRLGRFAKSDRDQQVDAALLWLCEPFHVVAPDEPAFAETLGRIVAELDFDGGVRRYPSDTYYGGGAWPVLTASLGWATRRPATLPGRSGAKTGSRTTSTTKAASVSSSAGTGATPSTTSSGLSAGADQPQTYFGRTPCTSCWPSSWRPAIRHRPPPLQLPMPSPQPIPRRRKGTPHDEEGNRSQQLETREPDALRRNRPGLHHARRRRRCYGPVAHHGGGVGT